MNKICTSIEQSQRLIELEIDVSTANMYWAPDVNIIVAEPYIIKTKDETLIPAYDGAIPAWSLSALLKLLPSEFEETGSFGTFKYKIDIRKYKSTDERDVYQIAYGNYLIGNSMGWKDMINTGWKEDLLDAAFEMILKLNELNLL